MSNLPCTAWRSPFSPLALAAPLGATAQFPDLLEINGETQSIHTNPLAPFLAANPGRLFQFTSEQYLTRIFERAP